MRWAHVHDENCSFVITTLHALIGRRSPVSANRQTDDRDTMSNSYQGTCFCGAVEIEVTGQPNAMGYCHCQSCRSWSGGPVNAFSLWQPDAVKVTKGADNIATYQKTEMSHRQYCRLCGGHLMTRHPPLKMIDVFAATIPD